ncbi:MAG: TolC family protein [Bacteroidales bacterium]|nr:TolC family protein [Bacteroidales bacterium]
MKKRIKLLLCLCFALGAASVVQAQETLTLGQCIQMAVDNNLSLQRSRNEIVKGKHAISENQARLLPQLNAVAQINDNFAPPVSVTDGRAYGKDYNVTKTLQYNASIGVQLQMPIYNQMARTAVEISKIASHLNELSYEKAREDIIMQTAQTYYMAQNTLEQIRLVNDNIKLLQELRKITKAFYDNQMSLEVDLKRVDFNIEDLTVARDNALSMLQQQYTMLKFILDYPAEKQIAVTGVNPGQIDEVKANGLSTGLYELQLLEQKRVLAQKQTKLAKDGYLPTVSLTGNIMYTAYTDKFKNWFHSGESNHWYGSNGIGIQVRMPLFDGFEKRSKVRKALAEEESARIGYEDALKRLQANYMNAVSEVENCQRNYKKQYDNYILAQEVYGVTAYQYKEGVTSMTAVLQDEMRISEAMNKYVSSHFSYKMANLSLLKLTGQLDQLK